jgi:hypothetical protein
MEKLLGFLPLGFFANIGGTRPKKPINQTLESNLSIQALNPPFTLNPALDGWVFCGF